jgi:hypothetical protein
MQATEGESSGVVDQPPPPESPRLPMEEQRQRQEEPHADDSLDTYVCGVCVCGSLISMLSDLLSTVATLKLGMRLCVQ